MIHESLPHLDNFFRTRVEFIPSFAGVSRARYHHVLSKKSGVDVVAEDEFAEICIGVGPE